MRVWLRAPLGALAMAVYLLSAVSMQTAPGSAAGILWASLALGGLAAASYIWRLWWVNLVLFGGVTMAIAGVSGAGHIAGAATAGGFAALVGWWSTLRPGWPPKPWYAFLTVGMLVMVSLSLAGLLALRPVPVDTRTVYALATLYLSTPPWEWGLVLTLLGQAKILSPFIRDHYRWGEKSLSHVITGFLAGIGIAAISAVAVSVEQHGFKMHVRANNPFVTTPSLTHSQWEAAFLVALAVIVLAPLAEEALFRGVLFGSLTARWGYLTGSVASAAIFGLAHLDLTLFIPLALAGIVLNALYHRTGSLIPSTIAHATLNAVSVFSVMASGGMIRF